MTHVSDPRIEQAAKAAYYLSPDRDGDDLRDLKWDEIDEDDRGLIRYQVSRVLRGARRAEITASTNVPTGTIICDSDGDYYKLYQTIPVPGHVRWSDTLNRYDGARNPKFPAQIIEWGSDA